MSPQSKELLALALVGGLILSAPLLGPLPAMIASLLLVLAAKMASVVERQWCRD